jgi:hypothetical protein
MKTLILLLGLAACALADNVTVTNPSNQPVPVRLIGTVVTLAQLPTSHSVGQTATVTDGAASLAWGATVTGGGTAKYLVWWNGTAWTVIGK